MLGTQVEREVFLVLVEEAELGALVRVDDGEDFGDGFAEVVAVVGEILLAFASSACWELLDVEKVGDEGMKRHTSL